jgi:SAM-dependent methyltransferase
MSSSRRNLRTAGRSLGAAPIPAASSSGERTGGTRLEADRRRRGADLAMYRTPRLYDVAFGFRDIAAECKGLLTLAARYGVAHPRSALELACGPAHHLRELSRRGLVCQGIDINEEMLGYARELCRRDGARVTLRRGDMRTFQTTKRFDLVLCLFDSFAQCTTESDAVATLRSAAAALKKGGLLFVEFTHPSDYFGKGRSRTSDSWTQREGDVTVKARFTVTRLDPVEETFVASLTIVPKAKKTPRGHVRSNGKAYGSEPIVMRWQQRMWMKGGFQFVALASGCFDIVGWYGDIDPIVPLDSGPRAWRMMAVLRRR